MAKEDFCFTYYDGDAARDKAHMTRLCRGAYDDLISMQRKVGPMTMEQIKMVLSSDFEICWPSIEFIIKKTPDEKYFIEWVQNSIINMRKSAKKQSETAKKRWDKKDEFNTTALKNDTTALKNDNSGMPLENVNESEEDILKEGTGRKLLIPEMFIIFKKHLPNYPGDQDKDFQPLLAIANFICKQLNGTGPPVNNLQLVLAEWEKISTWIAQDNFYSSKSLKTISTHIQEIFQKNKNEHKGAKANINRGNSAGSIYGNEKGAGAHAAGL